MVQIRTTLGELKGHFGTPRTPIESDVVVGAVYDGDWNFTVSKIAEWMFGGSVIVDTVEKVESGGKRSHGVWSVLSTLIPPRPIPIRVQMCIRTGYMRAVRPQQVVFDIARELALQKLMHCDISDCQNERLTSLTAMYCGFAELCVQHHLYERHLIECRHSDVHLLGKETILSPEEVRCAHYLISQMRVGSEPPCMEL
jgi:hypothetical protein